MYFKVIILICLWTNKTNCSIVIDQPGQSYININDYCPKKEPCDEGTHTLCMFYNPKEPMGPTCHNPVNVTFNDELAEHVLGIINNIRHRVATGKETGKDDKPLPRGYGIFRIRWDNELATFAQIMANQCYLKKDLCRATKKFSNPFQLSSLVRFLLGWVEFPGAQTDPTPGLTPQKMQTAIDKCIQPWYLVKNAITPELIANYASFDESVLVPSRGQRYLNLVHAPTTHMGCGISAFTQYAYSPSNQHVQYNIIVLVCNLSGTPTPGKEVYNTTHPGTPEFSAKCGCPKGSYEDDECLCNMKEKPPCPEIPKCIKRPKNLKQISEADANVCIDKLNCPEDVSVLPILNITRISENEKGLVSNRRSHFVHNRYFTKPVEQFHGPNRFRPTSNGHVPRGKNESIFSRVNKFVIPHDQIRPTKHIRNVVPRKDFTNAKNLVTSYLDKRRHLNGDKQVPRLMKEKLSSTVLDVHIKPIAPTKEPNTTIHNNSPTNYLKSDINNKLINILNSLEEDVKYFETKTESFDKKVKEIYGSDETIANNFNHFEKHLIDDIKHAKQLLYERDLEVVFPKNDEAKDPVPATRNYKQILSEADKYTNDYRKTKWRKLSALVHQDVKNSRNIKKLKNTDDNIKFVQRRKSSKHFGNNVEDEPLDRRLYYQTMLESVQKKLRSMHGLKHGDNSQLERRALRPSGRQNSRNIIHLQDRARVLHDI